MTQPGDRWRLALLADTHIEPDRSPTPRSNARTQAIVEQINRGGFDAAIHLGDVVHPLPSMPNAEPAWQAATGILSHLAMPLHVIPGNHDIGDKPLSWLPAKSVRPDWSASFEARFGPACRAVDHGGIRLILLNAPLLNSGFDGEAGQWRQLERLLAERTYRRLFAFIHYPPFLVSPDEPSHYDNLDEPARGRLLDHLVTHGCEAVFCAHVHHRFLSHHEDMEIHTVPSTSFTRRDYVETHPLAPDASHEYGRNLETKLGFIELCIDDDGFDARFHRLDGLFATRREPHSLGVDLRHDWCEVRPLPFNPPTDAFQRRRVRDDRAVLAMLDLGIRHARIPIEDIIDPQTRDRAAGLAKRGVRWTVFCLGSLSAGQGRVIAEHAWMIDGVETIGDAVPRSLASPVMLAPLITSRDTVTGDTNLSQFTGWGLSLADVQALPDELTAGIDGYVIHVPWGQRLDAIAADILDIATSRGWRLHVTVGFMADRPDRSIEDEEAIAARVADAFALAHRSPSIRVFLDTFEDIDRGYFVRRGLIDRRGDPTAAGLALAGMEWPTASTIQGRSTT